ncbi:septum formation initiator family protein [Patescibacteria group bacterium]|nr:septum formation initiator family protein [Patescibacteria group bacterium]
MIAKFSRFRKKKTGGLFFIIFTGFSVAAAIVFLIILNLKINQERAKLQSEIENLQQQLQKSQSIREELLSKISKAQTEEYLEKVARQDLNLQKEGEKAVAFPVIKEEGREEEEVEEKNFLQKIFEIFKIRRD